MKKQYIPLLDDLVRIPGFKTAFSKTDTTNSIYQLYTIIEKIYDSNASCQINCFREWFNETPLEQLS